MNINHKKEVFYKIGRNTFKAIIDIAICYNIPYHKAVNCVRKRQMPNGDVVRRAIRIK